MKSVKITEKNLLSVLMLPCCRAAYKHTGEHGEGITFDILCHPGVHVYAEVGSVIKLTSTDAPSAVEVKDPL